MKPNSYRLPGLFSIKSIIPGKGILIHFVICVSHLVPEWVLIMENSFAGEPCWPAAMALSLAPRVNGAYQPVGIILVVSLTHSNDIL